jgi:hypothetical protein
MVQLIARKLVSQLDSEVVQGVNLISRHVYAGSIVVQGRMISRSMPMARRRTKGTRSYLVQLINTLLGPEDVQGCVEY